MNLPPQTYLAGFYGLAVVGSGVLRFVQREGGHAGLWFGLVMGIVALIAAICFAWQKNVAAYGLIGFAVLVVGGWFVYEALIKKGFAQAELRMLVIIGLTAATTVLLLVIPYPSVTAVDSKKQPMK